MLPIQPEVPQLAKPEVTKQQNLSPSSLSEDKVSLTSPPLLKAEGQTPQPVAKGTKTLQPVVDSASTRSAERLVIIGSGLSACSAALAACSERTPPLLITGPTPGGTLASAGSLEY